MSDKPNYITFKGTLNFIKPDKLWYEACPSENCNKKVTAHSDGAWHCDKCNQTFEKCEYRYMLTTTFIDHTAQTYVSGFNDAGLVIFQNVPAQQVAEYKEAVDGTDGVFEAYIKSMCYRQYVVKARVKSETWQDVTRVKTSIVALSEIDYKQESRELLKAINALK